MGLSELTSSEAKILLNDLLKYPHSITKENILTIIKRVSVTDPKANSNSTTLLFAGGFQEEEGYVHISKIQSALYKNGQENYRVISRSAVPDTLYSDECKKVVKHAIINENRLKQKKLSERELDKAVTAYINNGPDSLWGNRSAAFAAETIGDVKILAGENLAEVSILYHAEIPELLKSNTYKGTINGLTKDQLNAFLNTFDGQGLDEKELNNLLGSAIANKAQVDMKDLTIVYGKNKKIISVGFEPIDLTKITEEITDIKKGNQLFKEYDKILEYQKLSGKLFNPEFNEKLTKIFADNPDDKEKLIKGLIDDETRKLIKDVDLPKTSNLASIAKKLGKIGFGLTLALLAFDVQTAFANDQPKEAGKAIIKFTSEELAGYGGAIGGIALATVLTGFLGVTGIAAGAIILISGFAGGYIGTTSAGWVVDEVFESGLQKFLLDKYEDLRYGPGENTRPINGLGISEEINGSTKNDYIFGGGGNDTICGNDGRDFISGETGNDTLYGEDGNDFIYGGDGDDKLYGGEGNDLLEGNKDNDRLDGGNGSDTYVFNKGDGIDIIKDTGDSSDKDVIVFGGGINPQDIVAHRKGNNLELHIKNSTDKIILEDYYKGAIYNAYHDSSIEQIMFSDGTVWDKNKLSEIPLYGNENSGPEIIYGTNKNDTIFGLGGTDMIHAGAGKDIINGGTGNDYLDGGSGSDIYVFDLDFGKDVISEHALSGNDNLTSTIKITAYESNKIIYKRFSDDLIIDIAGTENSITVKGYFKGGKETANVDLEFKDGKMAAEDLKNIMLGISKEKKITKLNMGTPDDETMNRILVRNFTKDPSLLQKLKSTAKLEDLELYEDSLKSIEKIKNIDSDIKKMLWYAIYAQNTGRVSNGKEEFDDAAKRRVDPLILDLNNNSIFTTSLDKGTHFDFAGDGFSEKTGWIEKEDGFLVLDKNQNNKIDNGNELFGDRTVLNDGTFARFGFEALAEYDINKDGVINKDDEIYNKLKVWIDANGDGVSQDGELKTLDSLKIKELNLNYKLKNIVDSNGHIVSREGSFLKDDGTINLIGELNFETNTSDTLQKNPISIPDEIKNYMPELYASGKVYSLQQAMTMDSNLIDLVYDFAISQNINEKEALVTQILNKWTGAENIKDDSRGDYVNAKHLYILEQFNGRNFVGVNGTNPNGTAGPLLEKAYANLKLLT